MLDILFILFFPVLLVLFVCLLIAHNFILKSLKVKHSSLWESLGKPTLASNNSISVGMRMVRFFFSREYRNIGDEKLEVVCNFYTGFVFFYLILFVSEILIFILLVAR